jgi:hypothetical protein
VKLGAVLLAVMVLATGCGSLRLCCATSQIPSGAPVSAKPSELIDQRERRPSRLALPKWVLSLAQHGEEGSNMPPKGPRYGTLHIGDPELREAIEKQGIPRCRP